MGYYLNRRPELIGLVTEQEAAGLAHLRGLQQEIAEWPGGAPYPAAVILAYDAAHISTRPDGVLIFGGPSPDLADDDGIGAEEINRAERRASNTGYGRIGRS